MIHDMRTTLDLDDDILLFAKERAANSGRTAGQVVSDLVRTALESAARTTGGPKARNGVPLLARRQAGAPCPTMKLVNDLRDAQ